MIYQENEINILCRLLRYGKLIGYEDLPILDKKEADEALESLIKKGIIKEEKFTPYGLALAKFLSLYNEARIFYKFGTMNLANYQENEFVVMEKSKQGFRIEAMKQDEITAIILTKFADEWKTIEDGDSKVKLVSNKRFLNFMEEHPNIPMLTYYKIDLDNEEERKAVLFYDEGKLQHYNATLEELSIYPKNYVQQGIEKIFQKRG